MLSIELCRLCKPLWARLEAEELGGNFTPSCFLVHTFQVPGRFFSLFLWGSHCHQNHFRQPDKNQDLAQFQAYRITISWACQSASHKWPQVIPMPRPTTTTQGEWVMRQPRSTYPWRNPFLPPRYPEDRGPIDLRAEMSSATQDSVRIQGHPRWKKTSLQVFSFPRFSQYFLVKETFQKMMFGKSIRSLNRRMALHETLKRQA